MNTTNGKWRKVQLRDLCREDRRTLDPESDVARTLPYISLEHIESGSGRILKNPREPLSDSGKSTTFAFNESHVLYGKLRPYLNKVALPEFAGRCTTELIPLLPLKGTNRDFLAWLLRRREIVNAAMQNKTGSRMPRADMDSLLKIEVDVPISEDDQKRIAAILNEQIETVESARKAADEQLAAAKALPASYLREVFESAEACRWPTAKLGDLLILRKDVIHPRDNPSGDATFVGLEHIESLTGRRIGCLSVKKEALTGRKPQFYEGDIVYGYLRPYLNKLWIAEFDGLCSVDQYVYSVNTSRANTEFVAWFMRSPAYLKRAPIDTTPGQLPRIRTEEVATVDIGLPALNQQEKIARAISTKMATSFEIKESLSTRLASIHKVAPALLRRAFSGEL